MPEPLHPHLDPVTGPVGTDNPYPRFIDMASHDLEAPLRKLGILTERLTQKYADLTNAAEIDGYTSRIDNCLREMKAIIRDLRTYGNTCLGETQFSDCDLNKIVRSVINELTPHMQRLNASVDYSGMPTVVGDYQQLKELIKALLSNALIFSKNEISPIITFSVSKVNTAEKPDNTLQSEYSYFRIEVADNGIGFGQQDAELIFEPFVKLHGKNFEGTGLGLAIARQVATNHDGMIFCQAEENIGARFTLLLPDKH